MSLLRGPIARGTSRDGPRPCPRTAPVTKLEFDDLQRDSDFARQRAPRRGAWLPPPASAAPESDDPLSVATVAAPKDERRDWLDCVNLLRLFRVEWNLCAARARPRKPRCSWPARSATPAPHRRLTTPPCDRVGRAASPLQMIVGFGLFLLMCAVCILGRPVDSLFFRAPVPRSAGELSHELRQSMLNASQARAPLPALTAARLGRPASACSRGSTRHAGHAPCPPLPPPHALHASADAARRARARALA